MNDKGQHRQRKFLLNRFTTQLADLRRNSCFRIWLTWFLTLIAVFVAGVVLLPLVRSQPAGIHDFFNGLARWQRVLFTFIVCVLFTHSIIKLFSPHPNHLKYLAEHPPIWLAWAVAIVLVGLIDVIWGLDSKVYQATIWEWIGYGLGSVALVTSYRWINSPADESAKDDIRQTQVESTTSLAGNWDAMEKWLAKDAPAEFDFLGHREEAKRLAKMLLDGTGSIGIVGAFGAGKTSIVKWTMEEVQRIRASNPPELLVSQHSCWGFDDSASSIEAMLVGAISKIGQRIDVFSISSLPEAYRQTFSAGGEWIDRLSKLFLGKRDPIEQFRRLSDLLAEMNARLVFVVEDLDRNNSRNFDIQDVLGFLQQLKDFDRLSFILTGGLNSPIKIDFAKLCDHIELLRTVDAEMSAELVTHVRNRCLDQKVFPHKTVRNPDENPWVVSAWGLLLRYDDLWPPFALAILCNTPRALRHALGRTFRAWQSLVGEIDWDHLFAVNVLRFAAPECYSFLLRHWSRFCHTPAERRIEKEELQKIRKSLRNEWNSVTKNVDWDTRSARTLVGFILPASKQWLDDTGSSSDRSVQGVQSQRYWLRAINEAIGEEEVRDQTVLRDLHQWRDAPNGDSPLISGICGSEAYSDVWEHLAPSFLAGRPNHLLLISQQVLDRISSRDGAEASHESQGFAAVWRVANTYAGLAPENRLWLEARITDASKVSLALVHDLWHFWGWGGHCILLPPDQIEVRRHFVGILKSQLTDAQTLARVIHPKNRYVLYSLVFDPGEHRPTDVGLASWSWLGPMLFESVQQGNPTVAVGVCSLIVLREGDSRKEPTNVDPRLMFGFFGDNAGQLVEALERLVSQVPEQDRQFVSDVVKSAKQAISRGKSEAN